MVNLSLVFISPYNEEGIIHVSINIVTQTLLSYRRNHPPYIYTAVRTVWLRSLATSLVSTSNINLAQRDFKPLNAELNTICYLLALIGAHHFFHVSRIRVKLLTLR